MAEEIPTSTDKDTAEIVGDLERTYQDREVGERVITDAPLADDVEDINVARTLKVPRPI